MKAKYYIEYKYGNGPWERIDEASSVRSVLGLMYDYNLAYGRDPNASLRVKHRGEVVNPYELL